MNRTIHIVCLDAPSPPDYGGAIDMYYKVRALAQAGNKIILHYFDYKPLRGSGTLKDVCSEVYSYPRKSFLNSISLSKPFIVASRINKELAIRLNQDDHPILLEGLHCTGIIPMIKDPSRVVIRMHNEEESYYLSLFHSASSIVRKAYFKIESKLIRRYQQTLDRQIKIACLSHTDIEKFTEAGFSKLHFIPCFIPWRHNTSVPGKGKYCLYHGNMSIAENERSARWLIENVFSKIDIPFLIAGNKVSAGLEEFANRFSNVSVVKDPAIEKLDGIIREAHINVLPSMNTTGVKLKLLHAVFGGRFCISNAEGIKGSGITHGIYIAEKAEDVISFVEKLMHLDFKHADIEERRKISAIYNNAENAARLSAIW
jgi:hypothetical protein